MIMYLYYQIVTDEELKKSPSAITGKTANGTEVTLCPIEECGNYDCVMLSRPDFIERGYDPEKLTQKDMQGIADAIGDCLLATGQFWEDIDYWAGYYKLPKL